jgi:hypothetical protein
MKLTAWLDFDDDGRLDMKKDLQLPMNKTHFQNGKANIDLSNFGNMNYIQLFIFLNITDAAEIGKTISIAIAGPQDMKVSPQTVGIVFSPFDELSATLITDGSGSRDTISDHIVINEIGTYKSGLSRYVDWIEIINPTASAITVTNWKINVTLDGDTYTFCTFNGDIAAGDTMVCDHDSHDYRHTFTFD